MTPATVTLTLTAREVADLRLAARAHRRVLLGVDGDAPAFLAARLAILAPRLTDALDLLQDGAA